MSIKAVDSHIRPVSQVERIGIKISGGSVSRRFVRVDQLSDGRVLITPVGGEDSSFTEEMAEQLASFDPMDRESRPRCFSVNVLRKKINKIKAAKLKKKKISAKEKKT